MWNLMDPDTGYAPLHSVESVRGNNWGKVLIQRIRTLHQHWSSARQGRSPKLTSLITRQLSRRKMRRSTQAAVKSFSHISTPSTPSTCSAACSLPLTTTLLRTVTLSAAHSMTSLTNACCIPPILPIISLRLCSSAPIPPAKMRSISTLPEMLMAFGEWTPQLGRLSQSTTRCIRLRIGT